MTGLAWVGLADAQESRFSVSADGAQVDFDLHDVPRRKAFEQLFAGRDITFEWRNPAFADEPISGTFTGTLSGAARHLLARTNFVIAYAPKDGEPRISRIVVVGSSGGEQSSPGIAAIEAALQPRTQAAAASPKTSPAAAPAPSSVAVQTPRPGDAGRGDARRPTARAAPGQIAAPQAASPRLAAQPAAGGQNPAPAASTSGQSMNTSPVAPATLRSLVPSQPASGQGPPLTPAIRAAPGTEPPASGAGPVGFPVQVGARP